MTKASFIRAQEILGRLRHLNDVLKELENECVLPTVLYKDIGIQDMPPDTLIKVMKEHFVFRLKVERDQLQKELDSL